MNNADPDLLSRSSEMRDAIGETLAQTAGLFDTSEKSRACSVLCNLSGEHGDAVLTLFAAGMPTSAVAILRVQFECLVRAIWTYYSATPDQLTAILADLSTESTAARNLPTANPMLAQLEASNAPIAAVQSLRNFEKHNWRALNSYVHTGVHAFHRHHQGMPMEMVFALVKHSNGLVLMAGMMLAMLTGNSNATKGIGRLQGQFADALPGADLQT